MARNIVIKGARANNLKNIDVTIPREKLVVMTGLSGSGKSSLAFDTLYAEGHRRFVESLSSYARQFLGQLDKPEVDMIEGLSPAISIDQKTTSRNPRSTVGTVTEIYDYLRLLYARVGIPHCPICGKEIVRQTTDSIAKRVLALEEGTRFLVLAPMARGAKGTHEKVFEDARKSGYTRVRVDGIMYDLEEEIKLEKNIKHDVDVVIDRLICREGVRTRLVDSLETALGLTDGIVSILVLDRDGGEGEILSFSQHYACDEHGISVGELEPRMFSFNNPFGACPECSGLGELREISPDKLIPDRSLTLREGAIACNGFKSPEEESWMGPLFIAVGRDFGFDLDTPIEKFDDKAYQALMYGTGAKKYSVIRYFGGESTVQNIPYEGVVSMVKRRLEGPFNPEYYEEFIEETECPVCHGTRLNPIARAVTVGGKNIDEICRMPVSDLARFYSELELEGSDAVIAHEILKEIRARLDFLNSVGLEYLSLARKAGTLSGGEAQRIRLATQIGSALTGVMYILDEPSIGLHQRDNSKLIATLGRLRDLGNTVIVVEHDEETVAAADFVVDIGPGAGIHGGHLVAAGTPAEVAANEASITGDYLSGRKCIPVPETRRPGNGNFLSVRGAAQNNLKNIDVDIPLGVLVCVTGVSGSGKSSLVNSIIYPTLARKLNRAHTRGGAHKEILGLEHLDKVIAIDQSPIGRMPSSNPATYTGLFTDIRDLFAKTRDAKARGYKSGRFSFNVKGGRCEACEGDGVKKIEMHFLSDVYVTCDVCKGKRYNRETLEIKYKGKSISDVLDMTVEEALEFFADLPRLEKKIRTLYEVGLGYIKLGQSSTTLSGGATELARRGTGRTMYILDEPTTGLHTHDVARLCDVLSRLVDGGNSMIVIEHNLDMIKTADYIIDLGPDGGDAGGRVIATGTPEEVAQVEGSYTGQYLRPLLEGRYE